ATGTVPPTPAAPDSAVGELGPPAVDGHLRIDRPAGSGAATAGAAGEVATALAQRLGAAAAEADGDAAGDPRITPGASLQVDGFASIFNGKWVVTTARHVFDIAEGGYRTYFSVHGREDRSLLGLTTDAGQQGSPFAGVVCAVVTNNNDPDAHGRVKVALPWLSTDFETDWAPVAQVSAGPGAGATFLPAVGDQVLVGFEFADARRPYVLGSMRTDTSTYDAGGPAIKASGQVTQVVRSGFASRSGNLVAFYDDLPPGAGSPPTASQLLLGAKDGKVALTFDQAAGSITLHCAPATPASKSTAGSITIECGAAGVVNIKTGAGGSVNIDGGDQLNLTAASQLKLECKGPVQIKGNPIQLN
ncbi:MAG: phage baseplate assembly protein V, partial [Jatrophihabitans sp.]